ncbi:DNA binding protein [Aureococcus anophagefferens]|nr:DNA binding protein [Aureococcus anophagefferens]
MRRLVAPWLALALVGVDAAIVVITPSDDSNCANEGYSDITSVSDCEAAIADANADMGLSGYGSPSSVTRHSTDGDKYLFCESSGAASSGGIGVVNPTTDGSKTCEDIGYCTITPLSDCEAAIDEANAAIGASGSGSPSSVSYSFYPTGCYAGCYSSYSGPSSCSRRRATTSLMRLDDGVYVDIFDLDYTDANDINAAAMYTDADGSFYPYAVFDSQLCRFDRYSVHCYDGTMGVDLANAAAIVGGDRRDHFYYSNALGEKEGDGLWYASDLDASHPTFHDLTLPVNSDLFSSTVIIGMMYDFRLFIARLGDDGAPEAYAIVQGAGVGLDPIERLFGAAWYLDTDDFDGAGTQPFQLLKATDDYYSLKKLDNGVYVDIFDLDYTDANDINAAAMYTDADGSFYPYAVFDSQLCRFDRYSLYCYDGTMGVDLANAAAIVGGDRRPTGARRCHFDSSGSRCDYFYYSNALGEKEGDGLCDLFSSTVVDFAPATEDSGSDDIIADGVAGATYVREVADAAQRHTPAQIIGMMYDFKLFIARLGDDGAPEAYAIVQGTGVGLDPIERLFGAAWYLDAGDFDGVFFAGNGAEGIFTVITPIRNIDDDDCWNSGSDYSAHVACDAASAVVVLQSSDGQETPDNDGLIARPTRRTRKRDVAPDGRVRA